jgi:hypothetical protein
MADKLQEVRRVIVGSGCIYDPLKEIEFDQANFGVGLRDLAREWKCHG